MKVVVIKANWFKGLCTGILMLCLSLSSTGFAQSQSCDVSIVVVPANKTICLGESAVLTAEPEGVEPYSYAWSTNEDTAIITVSPSVTTTYIVTLTDGNACSAQDTVTIEVLPLNTASAPSSTPILCINTALTPITHSTTGATGIGTALGLPSGVSASFSNNTITISGTPLVADTFNYTIPLTGGCGTVNATGTIIVRPDNTVSVPSSAPNICINTPLPSITHNTTGATGIGTASGLPTGVSAAFSGNVITISGTPQVAGTFNYSIPLTGGCGTVNATGTITVRPNNTVSAPSSSPNICINTPLPSITHSTTGATGIGTASGLPTGVSAVFSGNVITISGTPQVAGTFNYSIPLTGGCGTVSATGTMIVRPNNTVSAPSSSPNICINTPLPSITHSTTGATGIGTASGLPTGVSAVFSGNVITISGTPQVAGTFNYSIPLTGGCGTVNATGTIVVRPNNTVSAPSTSPNICINTQLPTITHSTVGATGIGTASGLPTGVSAVFSGNVITISGTPQVAGTFNYSIPLTGGCGTVNATGTIVVRPNNTVSAPSASPNICINTQLPSIIHNTTGATGIGTSSGLPAGVTATFSNSMITISGTPLVSGTFSYSIPLTGGCGTVSATGTIVVRPDNTASGPSSAPNICINSPLTPISHNTTGAAGIGTASGLPTGVSATFSGNVITISGTPQVAGTFNYSIPLTGGCGTVNATGSIIVRPDNTVSAPSGTPTLCIHTPLSPIFHSTSGATGIGPVSGLPAGVSAAFSNNTITLSGTPQSPGVFSYIIPLTGGCGIFNAQGTITVSQDVTLHLDPTPGQVCHEETVTLKALVSGGTTSGSWSDNNAGGIFLPDPLALNATYMPPSGYSGAITLTITSDLPPAPCPVMAASRTVLWRDEIALSSPKVLKGVAAVGAEWVLERQGIRPAGTILTGSIYRGDTYVASMDCQDDTCRMDKLPPLAAGGQDQETRFCLEVLYPEDPHCRDSACTIGYLVPFGDATLVTRLTNKADTIFCHAVTPVFSGLIKPITDIGVCNQSTPTYNYLLTITDLISGLEVFSSPTGNATGPSQISPIFTVAILPSGRYLARLHTVQGLCAEASDSMFFTVLPAVLPSPPIYSFSSAAGLDLDLLDAVLCPRDTYLISAAFNDKFLESNLIGTGFTFDNFIGSLTRVTGSSGGTQDVEVRFEVTGGCQYSDILRLTIRPSFDLLPSDQGSICNGDTLELAVVSPFTAVQWRKDGDTLALGGVLKYPPPLNDLTFTEAIRVQADRDGCRYLDSLELQVVKVSGALLPWPDTACLPGFFRVQVDQGVEVTRPEVPLGWEVDFFNDYFFRVRRSGTTDLRFPLRATFPGLNCRDTLDMQPGIPGAEPSDKVDSLFYDPCARTMLVPFELCAGSGQWFRMDERNGNLEALGHGVRFRLEEGDVQNLSHQRYLFLCGIDCPDGLALSLRGLSGDDPCIQETDWGFKAYPNPSGAELTLELFAKEEGMVQFQVLDIMGRLITREDLWQPAGRFVWYPDTSSWPSGAVILTIRDPAGHVHYLQHIISR